MLTTTPRARNIEATRRLLEEAFSRGNLDVLDELIAPDLVEHQRGLASDATGPRQAIELCRGWFTDFTITIEDLVADDERVWVRGTARGINTGSIFGRPPTGRPFEITVFDELRFRDGRIVEHWGVPDQLGMLLQVGLFGGPPEGAARG
jgi:ketosteroid isomerase-like protein